MQHVEKYAVPFAFAVISAIIVGIFFTRPAATLPEPVLTAEYVHTASTPRTLLGPQANFNDF